VGKPALWRNEIKGCCFQNTLLRVRSRASVPEYLLYLLRYDALSGRLGDAARGVGIHHLGARRIASWTVAVPPLGEQRRIVAAIEEQLSRLDAAELSLRAAQRKLAVLSERVVETALSGDWSWASTGDVTRVQGGIQKQPKRRPLRNTAPFLRVANVLRGKLDLSEVHAVELFDGELDRYRLVAGDLLVVEGNGSIEQIGRSAMWRGEIPDCVHQNHLIRVRPGPSLLPEFLDIYWNSAVTRRRLAKVASSTSGLYTLSTAKVKAVPVPIPSLEVQRRLVEDLDRQRSVVLNLASEVVTALRRSAALRRSVFERAFTGQLVPQDPTDEPASGLVEPVESKQAGTVKPPRRRRRVPA
jgi:type I restriction enzyme S subunit